jgi:hypothetical protein
MVAFGAQPLLYVIVAVPTLEPLTTPVVLDTGATVGLLLLQVPFKLVLLKDVLLLRHASVLPVMAAGTAFTLITLVAVPHPLM